MFGYFLMDILFMRPPSLYSGASFGAISKAIIKKAGKCPLSVEVYLNLLN